MHAGFVAAGECLHDLGAGRGGPGAAETGADQLHQHLGEEVVRVDVGGVDDAGQRWRFDPGELGAEGRRRAERDRGRDAHAGFAQAEVESAGGGERGVGREALGGLGAVAGVEGEAGERPDFGARGVARVGDAAKSVEDAVVGVEAPGDRPDARFADLPLELEDVGAQAAEEAPIERRRAQGGVSGADQVEAAAQDAVAIDSAVGLQQGRDPRFRSEPRQGGRGGEQLHVRGEWALPPRRPRADRPAGLTVDDEQAAGVTATPHEAGTHGCANVAARGRFGNCCEQEGRKQGTNSGRDCRGPPH